VLDVGELLASVTLPILYSARKKILVLMSSDGTYDEIQRKVCSSIGLNEKFLHFRRDGVSISYTVICLSHFDVCLAIT
jgi:hypothetical protein